MDGPARPASPWTEAGLAHDSGFSTAAPYIDAWGGRHHTVRLPDAPAGTRVAAALELSPFDRCNMGRAIPMVWFYRETLDVAALLAALGQALAAYPVLCGRYAATPPTAVALSNAGVPVLAVEAPSPLAAAVSHLPLAAGGSLAARGSIFRTDAHASFVPFKEDMDPDQGLPVALATAGAR